MISWFINDQKYLNFHSIKLYPTEIIQIFHFSISYPSINLRSRNWTLKIIKDLLFSAFSKTKEHHSQLPYSIRNIIDKHHLQPSSYEFFSKYLLFLQIHSFLFLFRLLFQAGSSWSLRVDSWLAQHWVMMNLRNLVEGNLERKSWDHQHYDS